MHLLFLILPTERVSALAVYDNRIYCDDAGRRECYIEVVRYTSSDREEYRTKIDHVHVNTVCNCMAQREGSHSHQFKIDELIEVMACYGTNQKRLLKKTTKQEEK